MRDVKGPSVIVQRLAMALALLLATGCSLLEPAVSCTEELRVSLEVDVLDAQTLQSAAPGSTVLLTGATLRDSVTVPTSSPPPYHPPIAAVWTEDKVGPGAYTVEVEKPNYQPWSQSNVRIVGDRCHVKSLVDVTAKLVPVGG